MSVPPSQPRALLLEVRAEPSFEEQERTTRAGLSTLLRPSPEAAGLIRRFVELLVAA